MLSNLTPADLRAIKREAKARKRRGGSMTYMQHLDQAARELYGVRHFHEATARAKRETLPVVQRSAASDYLQTVQEYYLDF